MSQVGVWVMVFPHFDHKVHENMYIYDIDAQCLRMDLNKKSGSKQKTIAGSKGTP